MVAAGKTLAQIAQAAATGLVGLPAAYAITYAHGNAGTLMQAVSNVFGVPFSTHELKP